MIKGVNSLTTFTKNHPQQQPIYVLFPGDYLSVISCYYQVLVEVPPTSAVSRHIIIASYAAYTSTGVRATPPPPGITGEPHVTTHQPVYVPPPPPGITGEPQVTTHQPVYVPPPPPPGITGEPQVTTHQLVYVPPPPPPGITGEPQVTTHQPVYVPPPPPPPPRNNR